MKELDQIFASIPRYLDMLNSAGESYRLSLNFPDQGAFGTRASSALDFDHPDIDQIALAALNGAGSFAGMRYELYPALAKSTFLANMARTLNYSILADNDGSILISRITNRDRDLRKDLGALNEYCAENLGCSIRSEAVEPQAFFPVAETRIKSARG